MKNKKTLIIVALLIIAAIIVISGWYVFRPSETSVEKKQADFSVEATGLVNEFNNDEQAANTKYLGNVIEVSGRLDDIVTEEETVSLTLKTPGEISGVICSFDKAALPEKLPEVGENVKIKGICSGYLLDVVLNKCSIEK